MKVTLIGGTGTLGTCLMEKLFNAGHEITCLSRGEHRQKQLKETFPEVRFVIGDVRDRSAVAEVVRGATAVFLLAAIKHVDVAEANPLEALKTNVLGAVNVAEECRRAGVTYVIYSNTDKAVLPITSYGYTKALAQNYLLGLNGKEGTSFSAYTWGNVVASNGSVIPLFVKALKAGEPVKITHPKMSRFWMRAEDAADYMLNTFRQASWYQAMIPPAKAATLTRVVESLARLLKVKDYGMEVIGLRGVEKLYEVLESTHAKCLRSDTCEQYSDVELDNLLRPYAV